MVDDPHRMALERAAEMNWVYWAKVLGAVLVGNALVLGIVACLPDPPPNKRAIACTERGGVYFYARGGSLCLKEEAILECYSGCKDK